MTIKITKAARTAIKAILREGNTYDAETLRIARDGAVTALQDADKTYAGYDPMRYLVGHVSDMVDAQGNRREGW